MEPTPVKLSIKEKVGYGLGDAASNIYFQTFIYFLLYFYTDVFGLSAAAAGTMLLVTRIWDAVNETGDRLRYRAGPDAEQLLDDRKAQDDATFIGTIKRLMRP